MEKATEEADVPAPDSPIVLQDPPRSKLKRQLSINTAQQSESLRSYKRPATIDRHLPRAISASASRDDVSDVGARYTTSRADVNAETEQGRESVDRSIDYRQKYKTLEDDGDEVDGADVATGSCASVSGISERRRMSKDTRVDEGVPQTKSKYQRIPSIYRSPPEEPRENIYENPSLPSPNRFNLADIGLTSPFMGRTSGGHDDVFVFPESSGRKVSPYKKSPNKSESHYEGECDPYLRKRHGGDSDLFTREESYASALTERDRSLQRLHEDRGRYSERESVSFPEHVCPVRGFRFPKRPSITDPAQFSPRVVSTDSKPRFPTATSTSGQRSQIPDIEEDRNRLRVLEREFARAKKIYGSPPPSPEIDSRQMSPSSQENVKATQRSISDVARSPNEKEIRETAEDVQNKYMRSISDPRSSPNQIRPLLQSPLVRAEKAGNSHAETLAESRQPPERFRDQWHDDVRRRLFMKADTNYSSREYQRHSSLYEQRPAPSSSRVSTEIPGEVLEFLHSKNFHPEDLDYLKDILRHGGSPSKAAAYDERRSPGRYEARRTGRPTFRHPPETGPSRERPLGSIDVRLTCTDFTENPDLAEILRDLEHESKPCKCAKIEAEMMKMIDNAYDKIPPPEVGVTSMEQYHKEIEGTHDVYYSAMKLLCGIKCLCKYGRMLDEVYTGSVVFRLHCPNMDALFDLWQVYTLGDLQKELQNSFVTDELLNKFGCTAIKLKVHIKREEYLECKHDLELQEEATLNRTPTKQITVIHARSRSEPAFMGRKVEDKRTEVTSMTSPFRDRFLSDSSMDSPSSPRRAFQELNAGKFPIHPPPPASKVRLFPDSMRITTPEEGTGSSLVRRKLASESGQENKP